jgi:uncharacterized protein (DUF2344 family)
MDLQKISTPVAIIVGCAILAVAFYLVQVDKRKSIEAEQEQQRVAEQEKREYEKEQKIEEEERLELQSKQDNCRSLASGVREKWDNVMGVTYSELWRECVVTYTDTDTGEVRTSPLSSMKTVY